MGASEFSSCTELSPPPFWSLPSSNEGISFVDTPQAFETVVQSLRSAAIVGLDCEWKPIARKRNGALSRGSPKVAVLQIACRKRAQLEDGKREALYVVDMLALKPATFAGPFKAMLSSPHILKLGYAFKDDLRHLAASHPGQDARGCFDKVENFVDVGKLFHRVRGPSDSSFLGTGGLSAIASTVLGLPLDKDLQCSDWEQRSLSEKQLVYAATDAYCLLPIYDALLQLSLREADPGKGRVFQLGSPPKKSSSPLGIAAALDLNPPTKNGAAAADISRAETSTDASVTCLLSACSISPVEAATAASLAAAGIEGTAEDVAVAMGRFSERLSLNNINLEVGSKKPRKRQGTRTRRPPDTTGAAVGQGSDDLDWSGPAPWEDGGGGEPKFLCDVHVEGLARQLRCVGFDTASAPGPKADPRQMVELAEREGRVLLTRDRNLIRRRLLPPNRAYLVKALGKQAQLKEVLSAFKLGVRARRLLCRCIRCNGDFIPTPLGPQEASAAAPWSQVVPECALRAHTEFWQCSVCRHIYWEGTQFQRAILQFEAAFEDILEGTVAEDRLRSNPTASTSDAIDGPPLVSDGLASDRVVGYCTEPGEDSQLIAEAAGPLGPLNDQRKNHGGYTGKSIDVHDGKKETTEIDGGLHKKPCKTCAERRKKKAERRQHNSGPCGADAL